jgi:hypothetical protein
MIPAFADLRSLHRTMKEMQRPPQSFGIASTSSKELFAIARANNLEIAMCVYPDNRPVEYVPLKP